MSELLQECPLCNQQDLEPFTVARDRHYGIRGTFKIDRCRNCELLFLNPMYSDRELSAMYPRDYYSYQSTVSDSSGKRLARRILGYHIHTKDPKFRIPGRVLDIGCGSGWFLREMRAKGWDVQGVEISESAAKVGKQIDGLEIFSGTVHDAGFASESFDYVRLNHSFEHMSRPKETLAEIRRILKPDGLLMIGVPNFAGLNAKLFGQYWWYLGAPVHVFTYSVGSLSRMLHEHGFDVVKTAYNSDYSGILGSLQIWLNRNSDRKSDEGLLFNTGVLRVLCHWAAKLSDLLHMGDAIELTARKSTVACRPNCTPL